MHYICVFVELSFNNPHKCYQDLFLNICLKTTRPVVSFLYLAHALLTFGSLQQAFLTWVSRTMVVAFKKKSLCYIHRAS